MHISKLVVVTLVSWGWGFLQNGACKGVKIRNEFPMAGGAEMPCCAGAQDIGVRRWIMEGVKW